MSIEIKRGGIQKAQLVSDCWCSDAELCAERVGDVFRINYLDFDAEACREAAKFFTLLAEDLEDNQ